MTVEERNGFWRSNLGIMMVTSGLWRVGLRMTHPFWALYVIHLGGDYIHIGLISAISSIFSLVPAFFGGYLADAVGRKKMIYSMSALMTFSTAIILLAPSWKWLLIARSLNAIFLGLRQPAFNALLADSTTAKNRAMSFGLWQTIPPMFGMLSPYIIGVLMDRYGILPAQRWAYMLSMALNTVSALMRFKFLTETQPSLPKGKATPRSTVRSTLKDFKETARILYRELWILIIMGGLVQFGATISGTFMVAYATEDVIHLTSAQWGFINTASTVFSMGGGLLFAMMADRYGRYKLVMVSLALTPLTILGFVYSRSFIQTLIPYISMTILASMGSVSSQALFIDYSPREHRGRINALTSVLGATQAFNIQMAAPMSSIIGAVSSLVGGILYGNISYASPLLLVAGTTLFATFIGALFVREPRQREE